MKQIKFFYGLSGTFKTTTILSESQHCNNPDIVWSMIKLWKDLESDEDIKGKIEKNHLNFALLHLCILGNSLKSSNKDEVMVFSERGVSDPLFYYGGGKQLPWFNKLIQEETELCGDLEIEKILLIQKDEKFIEEVVLNEPHRRAIFSNVNEYLKKQDEYIRFTMDYNLITKEIEIINAKEYIKSLGIEFKI